MAKERKVINYELHVSGVFGRNRSKKFKSFPLVKHVDADKRKTLEELLPLFQAKIAEVKVKSGTATLIEQPITLTDYGDGVETETFVLYSGRTMTEVGIS